MIDERTAGWGRAPEDAAEREQEEPDLVGRLSQRAAQAATKLAAEKGENDSLASHGLVCLSWDGKKKFALLRYGCFIRGFGRAVLAVAGEVMSQSITRFNQSLQPTNILSTNGYCHFSRQIWCWRAVFVV